MNDAKQQQLLKKVKTRTVKKLSPDVKLELSTIGGHLSTQMEQAVYYLTKNKILIWPLPEQEMKIVQSPHKADISELPRYLKIMILQNWNPVNLNLENMPDFQIWWMFANNLESIPKCAHCQIEDVKWRAHKRIFTKHCTRRCRALDPVVKAIQTATSIRRHGADKTFTNKDHLMSTRVSCMENHGVEFPLQSKEVWDRTELSKEANYGKFYKKVIYEKAVDTMRIRFGSGRQQNLGELLSDKRFTQKRKETRIANWLPDRLKGFSHLCTPLYSLDEYDNQNQLLKYRCCLCKSEFHDQLQGRIAPRCPTCFPPNAIRISQNYVADFISSFGVEVVSDTRTIISPLELDIFLPEYNIAIEYNGLYWHSDLGSRGRVDRKYHLNKTKLCDDLGIRLIHIFEDEWKDKNAIVKSIICQQINKTKKIYARKCTIKTVDNKVSSRFLTDNHIQGNVASKLKYGLYHQGELVQLMTFGKSRFDKNHQWEIYRMCSLLGHTIVGGASKLLKYFERNIKPTSIITYTDRRWFDGSSYVNMGMTQSHVTSPGYYYVDGNTGCRDRLNRMRFQKHKLSQLLPIYDPRLTEGVNMMNNNFGRVWDVGQLVHAKTFE